MNPTRTDKHPGQGTMYQVVYSFAKDEFSYAKALSIARKAATAELQHHLLHRDCVEPEGGAGPFQVVTKDRDCSPWRAACVVEHWVVGFQFTVKKRQPPKEQRNEPTR